MSIEFPLVNKRTSFGVIPDSLIPVEVLTKFGYQSLEFALDTGADFTMLPNHMVKVSNVDLSTCPQSRSYGIEGDGVKVYASQIQIKIGQVELKVRCLFSERETTPYIPGRADVFSRFNIVFDNRNKKIKLTEIK